MSWYLMERGWMDHRLLKESHYSKREAWCWLIENAAWEDHEITWGTKKIMVKRGQVPISYRKLCEAWGWTLGKVQRYINALKTDTMIDTQTDTGLFIITVCNYDKFQKPENLGDTRSDTQVDTLTDTQTDTNRKKTNNSKKRNKYTPTPQGGDVVLPMELHRHDKPTRFEDFWKIYPRKENKKQALDAYRAALKKINENDLLHAVKVMRSRFDNDDRDLTEKLKYTKYAQGWLNGERYLDYADQEIEQDDSKPPPGMTPDQHAKWVMRQMGDTP